MLLDKTFGGWLRSFEQDKNFQITHYYVSGIEYTPKTLNANFDGKGYPMYPKVHPAVWLNLSKLE